VTLYRPFGGHRFLSFMGVKRTVQLGEKDRDNLCNSNEED